MTGTQDGELVERAECAIAHLVFIGRDQLVETVRGSATTDKVATETGKLTAFLGMARREAIERDGS
jgi:hypothetical protein